MPSKPKKKQPAVSFPDNPPVRIEPGIICGDFVYVLVARNTWMPARVVFIMSFEEAVVKTFAAKPEHITVSSANMRLFDNPPDAPPRSDRERLTAFNAAVTAATEERNGGSLVHLSAECPLCGEAPQESTMCDWCPSSYCRDCIIASAKKTKDPKRAVDTDGDWRCPPCELGVAAYASKLRPAMDECAALCRADDAAKLFAIPVVEAFPNLAAAYAAVVASPMDFRTLTDRVAAGGFQSVGAFSAALRDIYDNAILFNDSSSTVVKDALRLRQKAAEHVKECRRRLRAAATAGGAVTRTGVEKRWIVTVGDEWPPAVAPDDGGTTPARGGGGGGGRGGGGGAGAGGAGGGAGGGGGGGGAAAVPEVVARVLSDALLRKRYEALRASDGAYGISERLLASYLLYDASAAVAPLPRRLSARAILETAASAVEDALASGAGVGAASARGVRAGARARARDSAAAAAAATCGVDAAQVRATCDDLVRQLNETVGMGRLLSKIERDALAEVRERAGTKRARNPPEPADVLGAPHAVRVVLLTAPRLQAMAVRPRSVCVCACMYMCTTIPAAPLHVPFPLHVYPHHHHNHHPPPLQEGSAADPAIAAICAIGAALDDQFDVMVDEFDVAA